MRNFAHFLLVTTLQFMPLRSIANTPLAALAAEPSPLLEIQGIDLLTGNDIHLKSTQKSGLVVLFLSAKCPCSHSHIEEVSSLAKKYSEFEFVAIHSNSDEDETLSKEYFKKMALPFPVIQDHKNTIADLFKAAKTPHAFIILKNGKSAYQGGVSSSKNFSKADHKYLREALEDLKQGHPVTTAEGRTLGCTITREEANVW